MWSLDAIADAALDALRNRDAQLRDEQAVYGLDAQPELSFHPVIAAGLATTGYGVLREQPFPHEWFRKVRPAPSGSELALPLPRDRMRCDIVLTPKTGEALDDALVVEKRRRADELEIQGTLFASLAASHLSPGAPSRLGNAPESPVERRSVPPENCFWLELKVCGQFTSTSGLPGPNRTYTGDLTRAPLADLKKLEADHRIVHAGVLLVVFTESEQVARHDINVLAHRILDRNCPIASPALRSFPIPDRIGNAVCTICLIGIRKHE